MKQKLTETEILNIIKEKFPNQEILAYNYTRGGRSEVTDEFILVLIFRQNMYLAWEIDLLQEGYPSLIFMMEKNL